MTSQNNNCSSDIISDDNDIVGDTCDKPPPLTWRTREGRIGENYV